MRSSTAAALCLAIAAAPRTGAAEPPARTVALAVDACVDADREQLDRLLALELAAAIPGARLGDDGAALRLGCDGGRVRIDWRGGDRSFERVIDPGQSAGRERTIVLAAVELAVADWIEHRPAPPPSPRVAVAEPEPILEDALAIEPPPPRRAARTTVSAGVFALGAGALTAEGVALRLGRDRATGLGWGWSIETGAARARDPVALGSIELDAATAAATAHLSAGLGAVRLHTGGGARFTAARFRGVPGPDADAGEVAGVAGGPMVTAGLAICAGRLCLDAGVESGWHALEVRADVDGAPGRALAGTWWAARLAAGARW